MEESDLVFEFDEQWVVKAYDKHPYYRLMSGLGLKGVDFIGIYQNRFLVLFEVKNYRVRYKDYEPEVDVENLQNTLHRKLEDTLMAIRVISRHLQNKWLFRQLQPLFEWLSPKWLKQNAWAFWSAVQRIVDSGEQQIIYVAWLDFSEERAEVGKTIRQNLHKTLGAQFGEGGPQIVMAHLEDPPFPAHLSIRLAAPKN
ncbi:MAG: hypothetical protein AAFP19_15860 [Bacteroidota bacterium]